MLSTTGSRSPVTAASRPRSSSATRPAAAPAPTSIASSRRTASSPTASRSPPTSASSAPTRRPATRPSHVVLHEPESGLLVSGDHLLGRISLFYDHGHTPDPVAEFIASLDVVDELDIRLCLPGHGRTFRDVGAKIAAYRKEVDAQLGTVRDALRDGEKTPFGVVEAMLGEGNTSGPAAAWALQLSLAYLDHLEALGEAERTPGTDPVLWRSTG